MAKPVDSNIVGQADLFADLPMHLAGAVADTTAKRKIGGSTYVLMLPADCIVFLFDNTLGGFLFRTSISKLSLSQFFRHSLLDYIRLFIELLAEHLEVHYRLLVQNDHTLARFGLGHLSGFFTIHIDHILIDQNGFTIITVKCRRNEKRVCPCRPVAMIQ